MKNFKNISISGRYIYSYLCIKSYLSFNPEIILPNYINELLIEFVNTNRKDNWQGLVDEILPSTVMDENFNPEIESKLNSLETKKIKEFYEGISGDLFNLIDNTFWLGLENLYGKYDSEITMPYVENNINILLKNHIELPDYQKISNLTSDINSGWGEITNMKKFI